MLSEEPFISIVVPTRRRPRQLSACLSALAAQDYPRERFEVVVVDDGGGDDGSMAASLAAFLDQLNVRLLKQAHAGPAAARNNGARAARGELLAFTDDDCAPDAGWLRALAAAFRAAPESAIGGRTLNALPANPYSTASQALLEYLYSYYNPLPMHAAFFASNNFALARESFLAFGGFDENFQGAAGEDRDFCDRWRHAGFLMSYAPEAVVHHAHKLTPRTFWRQHFNYGRSAVRFHRARAQRGAGRVRLEPLSFYTNLVRHPFHMGLTACGSVSALLIVSQLANAAGYFYERARPASVWQDWPRPASD
jgi:GT2 family glycosyltransferase